MTPRRPAVHILVPVEGVLAVPCELDRESPLTTTNPTLVTCGFCLACLNNLRLAAAYRAQHHLEPV